MNRCHPVGAVLISVTDPAGDNAVLLLLSSLNNKAIQSDAQDILKQLHGWSKFSYK